MFAYKVLFALAFVGIASAELLSAGSCPNSTIQVFNDFNVTQFFGMWYEFSKYPISSESNTKCVTAEYGPLANDNVSIVNKALEMSSNKPIEIVGYAVPVSNAKLNVVFNANATAATAGTLGYWVVGTDYNQYAVVYSCSNVESNAHSTYIWILTRERVPTAKVVEQAKNVMIQHGFYLEPLVETYQNGCF